MTPQTRQAPVLNGPSRASEVQPPKPLEPNMVARWGLDPSIAFLNHGSFGARLRSVMSAQSRLREEYEARPIEWLDRRRNGMIEESKSALAPFLGVSPQNFGFVTNATGGINAVLRSLTFNAGDELLTTNHVYNAVRQTMKYLAERSGATYTEIPIPLPLRTGGEIAAAVESALTSQTRIVVIDHISSPTAVIFPVARIIGTCRERGIDVLIDGAHAPGMIPLNIESLAPAYYAGNLHKWVTAPSGAAFLWARPDRQAGIHPTTISHFRNEGFANEFNWQGTRDITPWLCVRNALEEMGAFGWERIMRHNHQLAIWVQQLLCERWDVEPSTPLDGSMIGSMTTVLLPNQKALQRRFETIHALRLAIYDQYRIEVPVVDWDGRWWVRPCCQIYNTPDQYERLGEAIVELTGG